MSRNNDIRRSMLTELLEGQPARKRQKTNVTAPLSTLLLEGQRALEEKRYNDAITSFSNAICNISDRKADLLYLYELRATAYMKLGNMGSAIKDTKQMIRLDRADHRGYLKCAQVERSRGNLEEAVRISEYGLKSIRPNDSKRQSLEMYLLRLREAKKSQIIFERSTDPMEKLPSELLELVLAYFDYREVVAIIRVCKGWRNRLRTTDLITQSIDTQSTRKPLKHEHIKTAFNRLGNTPRKLHLSRLNDNAAHFVTMQLRSWLRLESVRSLTIDDAKVNIPKLRYEKLVSLREICLKQMPFAIRSVDDILQGCPVLEHATFMCNFANEAANRQEQMLRPVDNGKLRSLVIGQTSQINCAVYTPSLILRFDDTKPISTDLERLELDCAAFPADLDLSMHEKLTALALRNTTIANLKTPPTLENLQWSGPYVNIRFISSEQTQTPAHKLRTLDLKGTESLERLCQLLEQGLSRTHLRRLSITSFVILRNIGGFTLHSDLEFLTNLSRKAELVNVEHLTLRDDNLVDDNMAPLFNLFPNVRYLELESCSITEQIVTDHIRSEDSVLETITFRNCPKVSQDFEKWARVRGVEVEHIRQSSMSSSYATGGGRRVRYD